MFHTAEAFNQDISGWDVASVTDMEMMFYKASSFNHFVGGWTENSALTSTDMFKDACFSGKVYLVWQERKTERVSRSFD